MQILTQIQQLQRHIGNLQIINNQIILNQGLKVPMMVVEYQVVRVLLELGFGELLVGVGLRGLDLVQQGRVYLGQDL